MVWNCPRVADGYNWQFSQDILNRYDVQNRSAAPAAWRGGFGTCDRGGRPQTQTQVGPPTMDAPLGSWRQTTTSAKPWPHWDPGSTTRTAQESGNSRQLAQAQTRTLLASQITPPRKHSPCSRARMHDPYLVPDPVLGPVRVGPLGGRPRRLTTPGTAQEPPSEIPPASCRPTY